VNIVLLTIGFMGLVMLVMAVGVIAGRAPLKGSCGGPGGTDCLCEKRGEPPKCKALKEAAARLRAEQAAAERSQTPAS